MTDFSNNWYSTTIIPPNIIWYYRTDGKTICKDCQYMSYPFGRYYSDCILNKNKQSTSINSNCCDFYRQKI